MVILSLAMGLNTATAANAFQQGYFFLFGVNLFWAINWILLLIQIVFKV
jgi:hypothetical protein